MVKRSELSAPFIYLKGRFLSYPLQHEMSCMDALWLRRSPAQRTQSLSIATHIHRRQAKPPRAACTKLPPDSCHSTSVAHNKMSMGEKADEVRLKYDLATNFLDDAISSRHIEFNPSPQGIRIYKLYKIPWFHTKPLSDLM